MFVTSVRGWGAPINGVELKAGPELASLITQSWNQFVNWLKRFESLRPHLQTSLE